MSDSYSSDEEIYDIKIPKRNRKTCAVPSCSYKGRFLFRFPRNPWRRKTWKELCKVNRPLKEYSYVCRNHFTASDYRCQNKLKFDAVPSRNLPETDIPRLFGSRCVVPGCYNDSTSGFSLHFFPRSANYISEWMRLCHVKGATRRTVICSEHFVDSDFFIKHGKKRLRQWVNPSKKLPVASVSEPQVTHQSENSPEDSSSLEEDPPDELETAVRSILVEGRQNATAE